MKPTKLITVITFSLILVVFSSWLFYVESNTLELANEKIELDLTPEVITNEYLVETDKLYYFLSNSAYFKVDESFTDDTKIIVETSVYNEFGQLSLINNESTYRNYVYENYLYEFETVDDMTIYNYLFNGIMEDLSERTISNYDLVIYPTITIRVSEANKDLVITNGKGA